MRITEHFTRSGDLFFRWRSYLPLLLVPLFLASFMSSTDPGRSGGLGRAWELGCFGVSLLGLAIRVVTVGTAPRRTSGRNTREQKAEVLNTSGPYSVVRHPLYLGNYLIALGLALFSRTWFLPVIVSLATLLYYERIAAREEEFLEQRFGEDFRRWAARVPALIPRFSLYRPAVLPFNPRRALVREFYALSEITTAFFVAALTQDYIVTGRLELDPVWTSLLVAGGFVFAAMWTLKKSGRLRVR